MKPAKLLDQLLGTSGDLSWEVYRVNSLNNFNHLKMNSKHTQEKTNNDKQRLNLEDDVVGLHRVGAGEGRGAREQLKHQNSERPGR